MRATILPLAIVLTKAHRATVSMMAKGCTFSNLKFATARHNESKE